MAVKKKTIGFIGAGNMGAAIIAGIAKDFKIRVCEADKQKVARLKKQFGVVAVDLDKLVDACDIVVLAVKPQQFEEVLAEVKTSLSSSTLFISIAAGITSGYIQKKLGPKARVVRVMPNLPVTVKEGMTGVAAGRSAKQSDLRLAQKIFNSIGKAVVVNEGQLDTVTAVSGSGPAYVFYFAEAMTAAAKKLGLKGKAADAFVLQTLKGAVELLEQSKDDAAALRAKVTSKKGTTDAAIKAMKAGGFEKVIADGMKAAKARSKELSRS